MAFDKSEWTKKYYLKNKKKVLKYGRTPERKAYSAKWHREHLAKLKRKVIEKFSKGTMQCANCEESRLYCLSIDHINGGGRKQRQEISKSYNTYYNWLLDNGSLADFQVLCMNCQWEKRYLKKEYL